jgi:hypothetical protein
MKAHRLSEVREIVHSAEFHAWWEELGRAQTARAEAREKYDELLTQAMLMDFRAELAQKNAIDTLYRAGEYEDQASGMMADAQELENNSFKVVGEYEEHRYHVSELWYRLGAAEKNLEEGKDEVTALKARLGAAPAAASREIEAELKRAEAEHVHLQRTHRHCAEEYQKEHGRQQKLWADVEKLWARSAEMSLLVAEKRSQGKKIRKQAEGLFQDQGPPASRRGRSRVPGPRVRRASNRRASEEGPGALRLRLGRGIPLLEATRQPPSELVRSRVRRCRVLQHRSQGARRVRRRSAARRLLPGAGRRGASVPARGGPALRRLLSRGPKRASGPDSPPRNLKSPAPLKTGYGGAYG